MTSCKVCEAAIPQARRERWPWAVTCSRACADANTLEAGRQARRRYRHRRRAEARKERGHLE